jgi:glyoxylase-like metal-dependent hydrolase (beta-lactamase superfamily II)
MTVTQPLAEGDELSFRDRTLTVHHRPGHSPSDTIFFDAEHRTLLAADHLIASVSSNPLIARHVDSATVAKIPSALRTNTRSTNRIGSRKRWPR